MTLFYSAHLQVEVLYDEAVWAFVGAEGGALPDGGRLSPVRGLGQGLPANVKAAKWSQCSI